MNEFSKDAVGRPQRQIIVLDRDGVINRDSAAFIKSPDEWIPLPGSLEAIARMRAAGFTVVVASNQSGVGRGLFSVATLDRIHDKLRTLTAAVGGHVDSIFICPHHPDDGCDCRKPEAGLLRQVAEQYDRTGAELIVVGDSLRDLEAAWKIGARTILVRTGNGGVTEQNLPADKTVDVFDDLEAFAATLAT